MVVHIMRDLFKGHGNNKFAMQVDKSAIIALNDELIRTAKSVIQFLPVEGLLA